MATIKRFRYPGLAVGVVALGAIIAAGLHLWARSLDDLHRERARLQDVIRQERAAYYQLQDKYSEQETRLLAEAPIDDFPRAKFAAEVSTKLAPLRGQLAEQGERWTEAQQAFYSTETTRDAQHTRFWIVVIVVFVLTGLPSLLSIFFPKIGADKWRDIRDVRHPGYRMSLAGKVVAATIPFLLIFWRFVATGENLRSVEFAIGVTLTIVAIGVVFYDVWQSLRQRRQKGNSQI